MNIQICTNDILEGLTFLNLTHPSPCDMAKCNSLSETICLFVFPQNKGKLDRVAILVPRRFFNLCTVFVKYRKITRFGPMYKATVPLLTCIY